MAGKEVDIRFRTKADSRGAKEAKKGIDEVGRSAVSADKELDRLEDSAKDIRTELDKLDGLDPKIRKDTERFADSLERVAVTGRKVTQGQSAQAKANTKASLGFLEISRAVEDAQYGLRGTLNNLPRIVELFGGGAGLAGVVSLAAVALFQIGPKLLDVGERSEEAAKLAEELKNEIEAIATVSGDPRLNYLVDHLEDVTDALTVQNLELKSNRNLLIAKRKAELELAGLQDEADLAAIDLRAATDPTFTAEQQEEARLSIELRKLQREQDEKIFAAQQEVEKAYQEQRNTQEKLNATSAAKNEVDQTIKKLKEEELKLIQARNDSAKNLEEAGEIRDSFFTDAENLFPKGNRRRQQAAENLEVAAQLIFNSEDKQRLGEVQEQLKQALSTQDSLRGQVRQLENQVSAATVNFEQAIEISRLTEQTAPQIAGTKAELAKIESQTEQIQTSGKDLAANVDAILKATSEIEATGAFEAGRLENIRATLAKVIEDGRVTADELPKLIEALQLLTSTNLRNVERFFPVINSTQDMVRSQEQRIRVMEETTRDLKSKVKQVGRRQ